MPAGSGAHTQGRKLATARERIREVIALIEDIDDAASIELDEHVDLPASVQQLVAKAEAAARGAQEQLALAVAYKQQAAKALVDQVGLSTRDAGDVLGISHGRVHQLVAQRGSETKSEPATASRLGRSAARQRKAQSAAGRVLRNPKTSKLTKRVPKKAAAKKVAARKSH